MTRFFKPNLLTTSAGISLLIAAAPLHAEVLSSTNPTIKRSLCVGLDCADTEGTGTLHDQVQIKNINTRILFTDTSLATGSFPTADWSLEANETSSGGQDIFMLKDLTAGTTPLSVEGGAPTNAFRVTADGDIGMGTMLPQANLHIAGPDSASLRLEKTSSTPAPAGVWEFKATDLLTLWYRGPQAGKATMTVYPEAVSGAFLLQADGAIFNAFNLDYDFRVSSDVDAQALFVDGATGHVGIGTNMPEQKLHIRTATANTDSFALFDAAGAGSDAAFLLRQNGTVPTTWEFRNQEGSGRLNVGISGATRRSRLTTRLTITCCVWV